MRVTLVPNFQVEYSVQLANGLCKFVELTLLVWDKLVPDLMELLDPKVSVVKCGSPGSLLGPRIANETRISRFLRKNPTDIVHFQNAYVWRLPTLLLLSKMKCVLTIHDPIPQSGLPDPLSFLSIALHSRRAAALVTHGPRQRETLLERFSLDPDRVVVIPHGEFSFLDRLGSHLASDNGLTILFVGRIAQYKGLEYFLEAIPLVASRIPEARFRIVGAGSLRPYQATLSKLPYVEVENNHVPPAQIGREINRAAVVVAPYVRASQSGVVIAAQSLGRPVVASDVGGLRDDIVPGQTGVLVRPGDPVGLADALVTLLESSETRESMGRQAKEWMATARSWNKIARDTVALYEGIS